MEALLERLEYDEAPSAERRSQIRNRAAILRACTAVSGLFSAESPEAPAAKFFCGTAEPALLGKGYAVFTAVSVAGCGDRPGPAFERCIGEAVEYLSQLDGPGDSRVVADGDLRDAADFPSLSADPRIRAVALDSGAEVALPARLCVRQHGQSRQPTGTGCAAGRSWGEAVNSGLWELIERDAVAAWWHEGEPARPLPARIEDESLAYVARLRAGGAGRQTLFLDISCRPGLPTVAACSFTAHGEGFVAGFAAHIDVGEAARKAAREMLQMELGLQFVAAKRALGRAPLNEAELGQLRRASRVTPGHRPLRSAGEPRDHDSVADAASPDDILSTTVARLRSASVRVYAADLTRSRFRIPVARVLASGLRQVPDEAAWAAADPTGNVPLF